MSANYPTKLLLAFRSGDRCAFPGCGRALTVDSESGGDPAITGEAAHISGEKPGAARYDRNMTDAQRNHYNNLIYLCRNHHTQIDAQEQDFPVANLLLIKVEHESKVREAMNVAFSEVSSAELAHATAWISRIKPGSPSEEYTIIPPDDKIRKNELSIGSRRTILMGLSVAREVQAFIEQEAQLDSEFPERLKAGFLEEYYRLRKEGHRSDDLFDLMCQFSQRGMKEQSMRSAGLAILIYMFERCEVFEK